MNKGKKRSRALLAGLLLAPGVAAAIGVGPIQVQSGLGQRLKAQVELLSVAPDELQNLSVRLAPPQAFAQAGLDRTGALSDLQFAVEAQPGGRSVIRITSQRPVREPALNFLVELGSPRGKLMREFAILLDPVRPNERRETAGGYAGSPSAGGGTYGPIRPGETLWSIADRLRPADMPNREAVRRLYDANPEAFSRRSPDGLRAGATLRMPAESGWQGNPPAPAVPAPAQPPVTPPAVVTRPPASPAPATAKPPEMPPAGAQVRLLPPEGPSGGNALPAPGMGMTDQPRGPDPVAGGSYGQIDLDNGRLRLQAAGLDHLQNRIDTLPPAERVLPVPVTPPEPTRPASVTPPQPTPAPAPTPVAARPPVKPAPEPDFLDSVLLAFEDPLVLAGLGVAVAALLGGGLLAMRRARRAQEAEHERFESITLAEEHVAPGAVSLPAAAAGTAADPLERSSLLMSLGNHAEARALLESALAAAPDNTALRMRLLEVLHTLRDAAAFRREVGPLRQLVYGDTDPMWLRVARMGRELCPDDPMFIGTVAAAQPGTPAASPRLPVTPMPAPASTATAAPARMDDEVWSDLDFKPMDMPEAAPAALVPPKAPAVAPARLPPAAVVPPGPSLDFEPVEVRRQATEKPTPVQVPVPSATPEDLLADLGWSDADLGAPPAMPEKPVAAAAPRPADVADLDFSDDLAAFLPPRQTAAPTQPAAKPAAKPAALDPATAELADDLGFSFQPVSAPALAPAPVVPVQAPPSPLPASTAETRGEDEFVETKLDLALAYIDMDDPLGAKSLLEEVLQEGGSSQRSRAQALLERLAS